MGPQARSKQNRVDVQISVTISLLKNIAPITDAITREPQANTPSKAYTPSINTSPYVHQFSGNALGRTPKNSSLMLMDDGSSTFLVPQEEDVVNYSGYMQVGR